MIFLCIIHLVNEIRHKTYYYNSFIISKLNKSTTDQIHALLYRYKENMCIFLTIK